jgi:hypothetical protein
MTTFELTSMILLPLLVTGASLLAMSLGKQMSINARLVHNLITFKMNEGTLHATIAALKDKPQLKDTTVKLLRLAVKSDIPHEASAAAVQACKRIYLELGIK